MTQPSAANAKLVDKNNNPQLTNRLSAITAITDNSGGTGTDTLLDVEATYTEATLADNFATLADKIDELIEVLEAHGLIADN